MIMNRFIFLSYMVLGALPVSSYTVSDPGVQHGCYWTIPSVGTYNTHFNTDWNLNPGRAGNLGFEDHDVYESSVTLTVPGGQEILGPVSPTQLVTSHNDTLSGSVRTVAMLSNVPGVTHGYSMYSDDNQEIEFTFLTRDPANIHPTNEQVASDSPTTSYAATAPEDATTAWHEYRVDWMADRISFYVDGECVLNITDNVPQQAGYWLWNSWTKGSPQDDAIIRIRSIDAYYNRVSVAAVALLNPSWCGIGASTASASTSSTSTSSVLSGTETTSFPSSSATAIPAPMTFVGSIKGSSTSASTTATAVPIASFVPVTPMSSGFYLQSKSSGSSDTSYASVASGTAGQVSFVPSISSASRFTIDASGNLVEQSPTLGYAASLNFNINNQRVNFDSLGQSSRYGYLTCSVQSNILNCTVKGSSYSAVTCGGDGYLYFAQTVPRSCELVNLVSISS